MPAPAIAAGHAAGRGASSFTPAARRTILIVSLAWAVFILVFYFEQLWQAIAAGTAWEFGFYQDLRATGLPHAREAAFQALSALGSAALVIAAVFGCGIAADRWLTPAGLEPQERLVLRFGNGAGILSNLLLLAALVGVFRPEIVRVIVLALALIVVAALVRAPWKRILSARMVGVRRPLIRDSVPWIVVTILAVTLSLVAALAPETEYDALWYHLELPRQWLAAGHLTDNVHEYVSLYPGTWELLFGAALAFDGSAAARLLHWSTLGAAAIICGSIATRVLGVRTMWIAAAIFVTAPTVLWEATTTYVDLALALHGGIAVGALWLSTRKADRRWLVVAGLHFGLACATKHLGLVAAAVAIGCYILARLRADPPVRLARTVIFVALLTVLVPSPWYVRAWLASGNPVFPEMYSIFGASPAERWNGDTERELARFKERFGRPRTAANLARLPWDMTMHSWRYGGTLGPFALLFAPALIAVLCRQRAARWVLAGATAYVLVWASPISSFQLRFLVPWWLFLAPLIAAGIALLADSAARGWPPARMLIHAAVATLAVLNLPPFTRFHERDREGWNQWLTHVVHDVPLAVVSGATPADAYLGRHIRTYAAWQFLNAQAPPDARVLTFFGGDHFYADRARLWSESVAAIPATWGAADGRSALDALDRLGISYVMVPSRGPQRTKEHDRLPLLQPDVVSRFSVAFEEFWTIVYRVDARSRRDTPFTTESSGRASPGSSDHR